jgi:hypothetical protein
MCKEMLVIPVNRVVDPKRIIGKNGGPKRRRGTKGCRPKKKIKKLPPFARAGFDLTTHDSAGRDDTTTRTRHQGS